MPTFARNLHVRTTRDPPTAFSNGNQHHHHHHSTRGPRMRSGGLCTNDGQRRPRHSSASNIGPIRALKPHSSYLDRTRTLPPRSDGVFEGLATNGDPQLCGEDFDNRIVNYAVKLSGVTPKGQAVLSFRISTKLEKVPIVDEWKSPQTTRVTVSLLHGFPSLTTNDYAAKNAYRTNPRNTVCDGKSLIGHRTDESDVKKDTKHWPFSMVDRSGRPVTNPFSSEWGIDSLEGSLRGPFPIRKQSLTRASSSSPSSTRRLAFPPTSPHYHLHQRPLRNRDKQHHLNTSTSPLSPADATHAVATLDRTWRLTSTGTWPINLRSLNSQRRPSRDISAYVRALDRTWIHNTAFSTCVNFVLAASALRHHATQSKTTEVRQYYLLHSVLITARHDNIPTLPTRWSLHRSVQVLLVPLLPSPPSRYLLLLMYNVLDLLNNHPDRSFTSELGTALYCNLRQCITLLPPTFRTNALNPRVPFVHEQTRHDPPSPLSTMHDATLAPRAGRGREREQGSVGERSQKAGKGSSACLGEKGNSCNIAPLHRPYLAPPRNPTDLEQRRRAWWMCIMFDRIVSVGGWPHSIDERDVGTELPLRRVDFEAETGVPSNPQDLTAEGLFTRHNPLYTDPYLLFLKACLLFGRVTDYNTRMFNLRNAPRSEPTFSSSSASLEHPPNPSSKGIYVWRLASSCLGVVQQSGMGVEDVDWTALDTDLYMAHIVLHAATITLHNPYMDFGDLHCPSANRCLRAARSILNAYYLLMSTSFDIKRLHPFVTICWYLAAVVLVQQCRQLIDIGDRQNEAVVWGEINQLRQAMIDFGTVSPIGVRQEKLLQGLMTDITRLTSQAQPPNVPVPLYPFSRKSLYDPTFQSTIAEVVDASNKSTHNPGASSIERLLNRNSAPQPNQSHVLSHAAPLPAPTTYTEDTAALSMGTIGVGMELSGLSGLGVLGGVFGSTTMISAQGI
ncbi:hypothetical protein M407DRAFT_26222 [Tulasnella calospora MUT 4182]|uniref:Transcription factor domain-containing protein n=1 Tax=Tulasnella calospora MUT 4182 TaxID=1051891 RepID=A0A0C3QG09_9AGAM|nr:hypothetical protein M407DRAFT_26222 [Tulasnella calospora MUT 4182]